MVPSPVDLLQKIRTIPTEPGVYLYKNAEGEVIYVGKAKNLRSRVVVLFPRRPLDGREDRHAGARSGGRRLHRGRQQQGSAGARKQPDQAAQAALQHPAARRQDLSLREIDAGRALSPRVCDAAPAERWQRLLRPVLPCQPRLSDRGSDPSPLSGSLLQGGPDPLSSAAVSAVLHPALPGAVR